MRSLNSAQTSYYPEMYAYTLNSGHTTIHVHREVIPVLGEQGEIIGVLLVFYDQTEQHNLERAREEFSQMIIHDLRSPLTAVTVSERAEATYQRSEPSGAIKRSGPSQPRAPVARGHPASACPCPSRTWTIPSPRSWTISTVLSAPTSQRRGPVRHSTRRV